MILVYALATRGVSVRLPLRTVNAGALTAVVRPASRKPSPTEAALRAHDRAVTTLAESAPAILPVRFGTSFDDVDELRLVLGARQETLRRRLRAVRGRVQMTVRIVNSQPSTAVARASSGTPRSGAAYLKARAAAQAMPAFDPVRAAVRRWVRDERVETRGRVATVYHLVPRGAVSAYRRALARAAGDAGVRVVVSGPWPPYAFSTPF